MKYLKLFENFQDKESYIKILKLLSSGNKELSKLIAESIDRELDEILNHVLKTRTLYQQGKYHSVENKQIGQMTLDFKFIITFVEIGETHDMIDFEVEIERESIVRINNGTGSTMKLEDAVLMEEYGWRTEMEMMDLIVTTVKDEVSNFIGEEFNVEFDLIDYKFV